MISRTISLVVKDKSIEGLMFLVKEINDKLIEGKEHGEMYIHLEYISGESNKDMPILKITESFSLKEEHEQ